MIFISPQSNETQFPDYLHKNSSTISPEDKKRFDAQVSCIRRLLNEFEAKTYRDDDEKARAKIVDLMSEVCALYLIDDDLVHAHAVASVWIAARRGHGATSARLQHGSRWASQLAGWL